MAVVGGVEVEQAKRRANHVSDTKHTKHRYTKTSVPRRPFTKGLVTNWMNSANYPRKQVQARAAAGSTGARGQGSRPI